MKNYLLISIIIFSVIFAMSTYETKYYIISYQFKSSSGGIGSGNISLQCDFPCRFPSNDWFKEARTEAGKSAGVGESSVIIFNLMREQP